MQGSRIRNIIFDFGNVLFDLDLDSIGRELRRLTGAGFEAARRRLEAQRIFELYETGGLSTDEFVAAIRHAGQSALAPEQIIAAWNSIFIGMPRHRFDMLLQLRREYRVFLLSNINDLHAAWIDDYMLREHGIDDFATRYFDGVYYSHLIRLRKPDRAVYEYVLADAELAINVAGARQAGLHAFRHDPAGDVLQTLEQALQSLYLKQVYPAT